MASPTSTCWSFRASSFETTASLKPTAAVVLNVTPDHKDRYATLDAYAKAKRRVYRGAGTRVINRDDPLVAAMAEPDGPVVGFTVRAPEPRCFGLIPEEGGAWLAYEDERLMPVADLPIPGRHNVANALAALALGTAVRLPRGAMVSALRRFHGLPHRCQWVGRASGVDWYNDSKGTNVGATCAALRGLCAERPVILLAGGDGKGADFTPLASACDGGVRAAVTLGRDGPLIAKALQGVVPVARASDLTDAVSRPRAWRGPAMPCSCLRPAPASTCSGTTSSAASASSPRSASGCRRNPGRSRPGNNVSGAPGGVRRARQASLRCLPSHGPRGAQ